MNNVITVNALCKNLGDRTVLNRVSLDVNKGEIIGLLGVNGAGKTSFLKLLSGLLKPCQGQIRICAHEPWSERDRVLKHIGVLIETPVFYEHLSAYENIEIHLDYMDSKANIDALFSLVGLKEMKDKKVSTFSLGMKQRLAIARCISHNPQILLLDEPINGLDPVAIEEIRTLFLHLKKNGITIVISSHILNEILLTAESVIILSNGNLQELGKIDLLRERYADKIESYLIERMRHGYEKIDSIRA